MKMVVGSLVRTSDCLALYPSEGAALRYMFSPVMDPAWIAKNRKHCSLVKEDVPLLVLRNGSDARLVEVLAGDQKGWIIRYPTMIFRKVR